MGNRRTFTSEFKREAIRLVLECGIPITSAERQLDLHSNVLGNLVRAYKVDPEQAFPGHGRMKPEQAEIVRLRREIVRLKAERDILQKATAHSSDQRNTRYYASSYWRSCDGATRKTWAYGLPEGGALESMAKR